MNLFESRSMTAKETTPSKAKGQITTSSTAEYFAKNLQQVGFSSLTKSVLTTVKEAVDNALDACEDHHLLPEIWVEIEKVGAGTLKNSDRIRVKVSDNGPGIAQDDVSKVFGEYLASSKFGRGRCSRGQQGIGISAATTWAQLTAASGARVITKTASMRKAFKATIEVDIRNNKGRVVDKEMVDWNRPHGTEVEFEFDGRLQLNGEAGLLNYLMGNVLVNPHLTLHYKVQDQEATIERVNDVVPSIPQPTLPHPHTMKLGEFIAHSHLFGRVKTSVWLRKGFSRVSDHTLKELAGTKGFNRAILEKFVSSLTDSDFKDLFTTIQDLPLKAPSTQSVLSIGEEGLAKSIKRLGEIDFFSVNTRKPTICDFKPVQVEVAIARLEKRSSAESDSPVQILRFANRVPLQFDKAGCAIYQAITRVNWRAYGLAQPKNALPLGPYIIAVSVVSPFIKFKNASKETIDSSDELVEEIRRALIQAGQRLSRHIRREDRAADLEQKIRHIEQFAPILVDGLARILGVGTERKKRAEDGLKKILGRDTDEAEKKLEAAEDRLGAHLEDQKRRLGDAVATDTAPVEEEPVKIAKAKSSSKKSKISASKKTATTKKESASTKISATKKKKVPVASKKRAKK